MQLVRLIYASHFKANVASNELAAIHHTAVKNNPRVGVTGVLVFGDDQFIQCIEGGRSEVNRLFSAIESDKRHQDIQILDFSEISERDFEKWSMKLVLLTEENPKLKNLPEKGTFKPKTMSAATALSFLRQFK